MQACCYVKQSPFQIFEALSEYVKFKELCKSFIVFFLFQALNSLDKDKLPEGCPWPRLLSKGYTLQDFICFLISGLGKICRLDNFLRNDIIMWKSARCSIHHFLIQGTVKTQFKKNLNLQNPLLNKHIFQVKNHSI